MWFSWILWTIRLLCLVGWVKDRALNRQGTTHLVSITFSHVINNHINRISSAFLKFWLRFWEKRVHWWGCESDSTTLLCRFQSWSGWLLLWSFILRLFGLLWSYLFNVRFINLCILSAIPKGNNAFRTAIFAIPQTLLLNRRWFWASRVWFRRSLFSYTCLFLRRCSIVLWLFLLSNRRRWLHPMSHLWRCHCKTITRVIAFLHFLYIVRSCDMLKVSVFIERLSAARCN